MHYRHTLLNIVRETREVGVSLTLDVSTVNRYSQTNIGPVTVETVGGCHDTVIRL